MKFVRSNEHDQCFSGIYTYKNEFPSTCPPPPSCVSSKGHN